MSIEEQLKQLILSKHKSIREFCMDIDIPYSTVDSILKRGIENAGVGKIIKICRHFDISADALANGKIKFNNKTDLSVSDFSEFEKECIKKYRTLDQRGKNNVQNTLNHEYNLQKVHYDIKEERLLMMSDKDIDKQVENYRLELVAERGSNQSHKIQTKKA